MKQQTLPLVFIMIMASLSGCFSDDSKEPIPIDEEETFRNFSVVAPSTQELMFIMIILEPMKHIQNGFWMD